MIVIPVMPPRSLMPEHRLQAIVADEKNSLSTSHFVSAVGPIDGRSRRLAANAYSETPDHWTAIRTCVCLCAAVSMAFPLVVVCLWLVSRETSPGYPVLRVTGVPRGASWAWPGYGLPLLLVGVGYLAVFPPALMSNDSFCQWQQMLSGGYSDVAPAFHTMTNWLITRIWFSPAAIAWTQLLAMSLVVAWTLKRLRQWGLSRACAWGTSVLVGVMPAAGILSITLWKDIPYTIAFLILALWVMEMIQSRGQWLQRPASAFLLGVVLAMVALYRHNGLPVALGTPLLLAVPFYRQGLRLALALLVACGLIWGVRGPLYQALAIRTPATGTYEQIGMGNARGFFQVALAVNHIAAQMADDTPLADEERELLNGLHPLENGKWSYNTVDKTVDGPVGLDIIQGWKKWERKEDDLTALAVRLFWRNPLASLRHTWASASYIWRIRGTNLDNTVAFTPGGKLKYQKFRDRDGNFDWVEPKVPLPGLAWTFHNTWLFWRSALYLHVILFSSAIAMIRGGLARLGAFLIPILLQTGCLSLVSLTQEFRYQFPVYMIGWLYGGHLLLCVPRRAAP